MLTSTTVTQDNKHLFAEFQVEILCRQVTEDWRASTSPIPEILILSISFICTQSIVTALQSPGGSVGHLGNAAIR